jgi:O-Antigen ligase
VRVLFFERIGLIKPSRQIDWLVCTLYAAAFMEFVPQLSGWTALFGLCVGGLTISWCLRPQMPEGPPIFHLALGTFLLYATSSAIWALLGDVTPVNWARGIFPFLFLGLWLVLGKCQRGESERLTRAILFASVLWLLKIIVVSGWAAIQGESVWNTRLTLVVADAVLPFPLVVIPLLFFGPIPTSRRLSLGLTLMFLGVVLWAGYRSQIMIVAVLFMFKILVDLKKLKVVNLLLTMIAIYFFITMLPGDYSFLEAMRFRFHGLLNEHESSRVLEWHYVISQLESAPLIGKGIGWQVPSEITFAGIEVPEGFVVPESVGYVHNFIGYFLMTLGILGLTLYSILQLLPWILAVRVSWARIAIMLLFAFCLVEATFRLVQFNILLLVLWRIMFASKEDVLRNSSIKFARN